jgi:hypothetical protein
MYSRTTFLAFTFYLVLSNGLCQAQDTIFYFAGGIDVCKVLEINDTDIRFSRWQMSNGPVYNVSKSKVSLIVYSNGSSELFEVTNSQTSEVRTTYVAATINDKSMPATQSTIEYRSSIAPRPDVDLSRLGRIDALKFYNAHKNVGTATLVSMIYPFAGVIVGAVFLATKPNESAFISPDRSLFDYPEYKYSYRTQAEKMRLNAVLRNFGVGVAAWLLIIIALTSSF